MSLAAARLFHVNVNCTDLDRSTAFYVDGLGLERGVHTSSPAAQPGAAFGLDRVRWDAWILVGNRGFDGVAIDLLAWQEPSPTGAPPAAVNHTGFQRVGVLVPDLGAACAAVTRYGGACWSEPFAHTTKRGGEIPLVLASDPDGTALELVEGGGPAVTFVSVATADLDRSSAFYRALGFHESGRFRSDRADGAHLRIPGPVTMQEVVFTPPGGGDGFVMLVGFDEPAAHITTPRPANALGIGRAAFVVADLDAAVAELATRAVPTLSAPVTMEMGSGLPTLRFVCVPGPDGELLELIEQPAG